MVARGVVSEAKPVRPKKFIVALALSLIAVTLIAGLLFVKYRQAVNNNPTVQRNQLVSAVGAEVVLPTETPTISTVLDSSKITNPTLAAQAHDGDKLLIYPTARRLILYRPSIHKVVDILTIQNPASTAGTPTSSKPATSAK